MVWRRRHDAGGRGWYRRDGCGEVLQGLLGEDGRGKGEELKTLSSPKAGSRHGLGACSAAPSVDSTGNWCAAWLDGLLMVS
jgi:hypothetical protein